MTDIVQRLKEDHANNGGSLPFDAWQEIDRLRAEVEKLRAALNDLPAKIREAKKSSPYAHGMTEVFCYGLRDGYEAAAQVADFAVEAALAEEKKDV